MERTILILMTGLVLLAWGATATAGDVAVGKRKAEFCSECHEPADYAGEKAVDIEGWIREVIATGKVPSGKKHKKNLAERNLSDADIADIAAYLASEP